MPIDECQELKNIKYKTMLLSGNKNTLSTVIRDISNLDILLDEENAQSKKESWNKLDKSVKINKINNYINKLSNEYKLSNEEGKRKNKRYIYHRIRISPWRIHRRGNTYIELLPTVFTCYHDIQIAECGGNEDHDKYRGCAKDLLGLKKQTM